MFVFFSAESLDSFLTDLVELVSLYPQTVLCKDPITHVDRLHLLYYSAEHLQTEGRETSNSRAQDYYYYIITTYSSVIIN